MSNPNSIPAAQYLRMSTEHQQYSMANQAAAVEQYAEAHGFEIIRTYNDEGRSGLVLRHRTGLQRLLADVVAGNPGYKAILVYDVSRWGRFQDSDEAAHYEFLCKQAGVPIHYCAESFPNDGTLPSSILKALKRSMAAEFSRELGEKVFRGKMRLARMGFRVGGEAGYGLRRVIVSADRVPKHLLGRGENKWLATDRTILVPGPDFEVSWVRRIFEMALTHSRNQILRFLNHEGVPSDSNYRWTFSKLNYLLKNPAYTGCNVWGRTSQKLRTPQKAVAACDWVMCPGAFKSIIDSALFDRVQAKLRAKDCPRSPWHTDEYLLNHLKAILARHGRLSQRLLDREGPPSNATMRRRFGSLKRAFRLAGFRVPQRTLNVLKKHVLYAKLQSDVRTAIVRSCPKHLSEAALSRGTHHTILVDGLTHVLVTVCRGFYSKRGKLKWKVIPPKKSNEMVTLLCLLRPDSCQFHSYYLMPRITEQGPYEIKTEADPWLSVGRRLRSFSQFYQVALSMF